MKEKNICFFLRGYNLFYNFPSVSSLVLDGAKTVSEYMVQSIWFRCLKKSGMQGVAFRMLYPFCRSPRAGGAVDAEAARRRLERLHPDGSHSCRMENKLVRPFEYDLQIVIPAYNAERYIAECMDSVLGQKTGFRVWVTVVNDGSTDRTSDILRPYARKEDVKVIEQENRGHSGARNAGLAVIRARYVMFVDADDKLPEYAVEALMREAEDTGADIVEGGYSRFSDGGATSTFRHKRSVTEDWGVLYGFPWGKVYKSDLFARVGFPLGCQFEDTVCIYMLYPQCKAVATADEVVYLYRRNEQGATCALRGDVRTLDALWVTLRVLQDSREAGIPPTQRMYEAFLLDLRVNYTRLLTLRDEVHRDAFRVSADLMRRFFPGFRTGVASNRPLEQSLLQNDYGAYKLYGRCYVGR